MNFRRSYPDVRTEQAGVNSPDHLWRVRKQSLRKGPASIWYRRIRIFLCAAGLIWATGTALADHPDHSTTLVFPSKSHAPLRKATQTHLFLAIGPRTRVNNPQGVALTKLAVQDDPETDQDDDELTVYGVNAGNNEIIYNTSLVNIAIYREKPGKPGSLFHPRGITADAAGDVYVADMGHKRVVRLFNRQGKHLEYQSASRPDDPDFVPFDLSLAVDGTVFVSDSAGGRVWRWHPDTNQWDIILQNLQHPLGIVTYDAKDRWTRMKPSQFGVVADNGKTVVLADYRGNVRARYKPQEKNVMFRYIAADYFNNYYVTDMLNGRVVKIDRRGRFVDSIGTEGKGDYQFLKPQGIGIWKRFGQVCVAESYAAQYYLIGTDIKEPGFRFHPPVLQVEFTLTEGARVSISLRNEQSSETTEILSEQRLSQGHHLERWQVTDDFPAGVYHILIAASPAYSSTKYFTAREQLTWNYQTEKAKTR